MNLPRQILHDWRKSFKIYQSINYFVAVVSQDYEAQVYDLFVIKGNSAIFKCNVPSYVSDHIDVVSWHDTKGNEYSLPSEQRNFGIYANEWDYLRIYLKTKKNTKFNGYLFFEWMFVYSKFPLNPLVSFFDRFIDDCLLWKKMF